MQVFRIDDRCFFEAVEDVVDAQVGTQLAVHEILGDTGIDTGTVLDLSLRGQLVGDVKTIELQLRCRRDADVDRAFDIAADHRLLPVITDRAPVDLIPVDIA